MEYKNVSLSKYKSWGNDELPFKWVSTIDSIAGDNNCVIKYDRNYSWKESAVFVDDSNNNHILFIGALQCNESTLCTTVLHELAHIILNNNRQSSKDSVQNEKLAWKHATKLANEYRLPFDVYIKKRALFSYVHPIKKVFKFSPKIIKMLNSKKSGLHYNSSNIPLALGNNSKRRIKKAIKHISTRRERRENNRSCLL